jgi:hypothetical protein
MSASVGLTVETCQVKRRYSTSKAAKATMRRTQAKVGGAALNVFRCEHCDGWHMGHRPKRHGGRRRETA